MPGVFGYKKLSAFVAEGRQKGDLNVILARSIDMDDALFTPSILVAKRASRANAQEALFSRNRFYIPETFNFFGHRALFLSECDLFNFIYQQPVLLVLYLFAQHVIIYLYA